MVTVVSGSILVKLAAERLTAKQKLILRKVSSESLTSSSLARSLSRELGCSRTCIFTNLNQLKRCGLVEGGNGNGLELTDSGRLVSGNIGGDRYAV